MSTPAQIYLIRHGETVWSLSGQHTGRTDLALTGRGAAMAAELASALQPVNFSLVLTSPRLRARETCRLAGLSAGAEIEPNLAEWDYGDYEGLRTAEILKRQPDWSLWEDGCPGGESPNDVSRRADELISRLYPLSGAVALFSHGHFGRVLAARWIGLPASHGRHFAIDPASIGILGTDVEHRNVRLISMWNVDATGAMRKTHPAP